MAKRSFNGFLYICLAVAMVAAAACIFLVAREAGETGGMGAFVMSLVLFPISWLIAPVTMAQNGDPSVLPMLQLSLLALAPPLVMTFSVRYSARRARKAEEARMAPVKLEPRHHSEWGEHAPGSVTIERRQPL